MHAPALARTDDLAGTAAIEKAFERPRKAENTTAMRIIICFAEGCCVGDCVAEESGGRSEWQSGQVKSSQVTGDDVPTRWDLT
jgi:hypothetical protein